MPAILLPPKYALFANLPSSRPVLSVHLPPLLVTTTSFSSSPSSSRLLALYPFYPLSRLPRVLSWPALSSILLPLPVPVTAAGTVRTWAPAARHSTPRAVTRPCKPLCCILLLLTTILLFFCCTSRPPLSNRFGQQTVTTPPPTPLAVLRSRARRMFALQGASVYNCVAHARLRG